MKSELSLVKTNPSHQSAPQVSALSPQPSLCRLYVVATPIGNLEDITLRALRVLREVDLVAAEDTRRTGQLLTHFGIRKRLISCHQFNEAKRTAELVEQLAAGKRVALVTDAGSPTISDPGGRLIRACAERGIAVEVVPGASAVIAALTAAGFGGDEFVFAGFLPTKSGQRRAALEKLAQETRTVAIYESPYRLLKTLGELQTICPERQVVVARELTKKFEEVVRGTAGDILKRLEGRAVKGEVTVVLAPTQPRD
jgi:16S rRNA (cytidine1402-2'-O)-methyltransferase